MTYPGVSWSRTQPWRAQGGTLCSEPAFLEKRSLGCISLEHRHSQPSLLLLLPRFGASSPSQVFWIWRSVDLSVSLPSWNAVHLGREASRAPPAGGQNKKTLWASDSSCPTYSPGDCATHLLSPAIALPGSENIQGLSDVKFYCP